MNHSREIRVNDIKVSGFTLVRNAQILDFPFRESVLSVLPLCDEFVINCGDSEDQTLKLCEELQAEYPDKIRILKTVWTRENQSGGYQLKAQTDAALKECRGQWLVYIQADEVFHECELENIRLGMHRADLLQNVDGLVFDYLHFYGNYSYLIRGRNWYRREVRAFKNGRGIESFRDAQGFRKEGRRLLAIPALAHVFHYGYVRSSEGLKTKSSQMSQWWGQKASENKEHYRLVKHIGLSHFQDSHPKVMESRIARNQDYVDPSRCKRKWDKNEFKNAVTLLWESIVPLRIGEYRNYEVFSP